MGIRLNYELTGRLQKMLFSLENPDFSSLMQSIGVVMDEDHVKGIMAGADKDGKAMAPVSYRGGGAVPLVPTPLKGKAARAAKKAATIKNWRWQAPLASKDDNLTMTEYRKLGGPPLAPRGLGSRVIRNFQTADGYDGKNWFVEAFLVNVLDRKGEPFMHYHFDGKGRNPKRDLRGIRPEGRERIRRLVALEIRRQFFDRS